MKIIDLLKSLNNTQSKKLCIEFADAKKDCDSYRFVGSIDEAVDFTLCISVPFVHDGAV